jgi:hypothetical protein
LCPQDVSSVELHDAAFAFQIAGLRLKRINEADV